MAGNNRGRIRCAPITRKHGLLAGLPVTLEPLAYTYVNFPAVPDGLLVRVKATGLLCQWVGGALKMLDQRKAGAALAYMEKMSKDRDNGEDADQR